MSTKMHEITVTFRVEAETAEQATALVNVIWPKRWPASLPSVYQAPAVPALDDLVDPDDVPSFD